MLAALVLLAFEVVFFWHHFRSASCCFKLLMRCRAPLRSGVHRICPARPLLAERLHLLALRFRHYRLFHGAPFVYVDPGSHAFGSYDLDDPVISIDIAAPLGIFPVPVLVGGIFGRALKLALRDAGTVAAKVGVVF